MDRYLIQVFHLFINSQLGMQDNYILHKVSSLFRLFKVSKLIIISPRKIQGLNFF